MAGREDETGATHTERMAERDGSAIGINVRRIIGQTELAQAGKRLAGESFIQLDEIEISDGKLQPRKKFFGRRYWTDAHDARRNARGGHAEETCSRCESVTLHGF